MIIKGKLWAIKSKENRLIDNIDTDMIFHNAHLAITDLSQMGQYSFGNLDGYKNFPELVKPGDIVMVGENFGCGSSRQQAVDCFKSLGINLIIAKSYGAIYYRNAVNNAFTILEKPDIEDSEFDSLQELEVDLEEGKLRNLTTNKTFSIKVLSHIQKQINSAGGLMKLGKVVS
ncbi:MAG: 3-isopropylmalate dehydratase [Pseudomonadota bacterium]